MIQTAQKTANRLSLPGNLKAVVSFIFLLILLFPPLYAAADSNKELVAAFQGKAPAEKVTVLVSLQGANSELKAIRNAHKRNKANNPTAVSYPEQRRKAIARHQQNLIERMNPAHARLARQYSELPILALKVDRQGLDQLLADPDVSVSGVRRYYPQLAESVPLIFDDSAYDASVARIDYNFDLVPDDGTGWAVAVLDTGIQSTHPLLGGRIVAEACYSDLADPGDSDPTIVPLCPSLLGNVHQSTETGSGEPCSVVDDDPYCSHGTNMAGVVAGDGNIYDGVAPKADLISIQVYTLDNNPGGGIFISSLEIVAGLNQALSLHQASNGINIASVLLAFATDEELNNCDSAESAIKTAIDNLKAEDIASIAAAGNNGNTNGVGSPACISTAIAVGATRSSTGDGDSNLQDTKWVNSNEGTTLDLYAPGVDITSSDVDSGEATASGTSFAAAHVAGAWALLKQAAPGITVDSARDKLQTSGVPVTDATPSGAKRIQLKAALNALKTTIKLVKVVQNPGGGSAVPTDFIMHITGGSFTGTEAYESGDLPIDVDPNVAYTVSEEPKPGFENYFQINLVCKDDANGSTVSNPVTLSDGQSVTCTFTNADQESRLIFPIKTKNGGAVIIDL